MSTTTSTLPAGVTAVVSTIESIVALALAGKLTGVSATVQTEIDTLDAEADTKLAALQAALDKAETSNPYVVEVISVLTNVAKATGFQLPTESLVFSTLKEVVDDLAKGLGGKTA